MEGLRRGGGGGGERGDDRSSFKPPVPEPGVVAPLGNISLTRTSLTRSIHLHRDSCHVAVAARNRQYLTYTSYGESYYKGILLIALLLETGNTSLLRHTKKAITRESRIESYCSETGANAFHMAHRSDWLLGTLSMPVLPSSNFSLRPPAHGCHSGADLYLCVLGLRLRTKLIQ